MSYGMESKRIVLSDKIFHDVRLSEQSIGIIAHALAVLEKAFSEEPQYRLMIAAARVAIANGIETPVIIQS